MCIYRKTEKEGMYVYTKIVYTYSIFCKASFHDDFLSTFLALNAKQHEPTVKCTNLSDE